MMKSTLVGLTTGVFLVTIFFWANLFRLAVNYTPTVGTNDLTDLHYPYRAFFSQSIRRGEFPLWSSETSSGYPFHASVAGALYPLNIISAWLPTTTSITFSIVTSYLLIYLAGFFYLRKIGLGTAASVFGGSLITLGGFAANEIMHLEILVSFSMFLMQLYVLERLFESRRKLFWVLALGLLLGLSLLGGHPQITFYSLLFLVPYWLFWWVAKRSGPLWKLLVYGLLYGVVGLGIGAGQFIPMFEFTQHSTRAAGLNVEVLERYNFPIADLVTFVRPFATFDYSHTMEAFVNNGWPKDEQYVYMGLLGLGLALIGLPLTRKLGARAAFFWVAVAGAMVFAFGSQFTTGYILRLPPFSYFRIPFKIIFVVNLSLGVLAAMVLDYLLNRLSRQGLPKLVLAAIAVSAIAVSFADLRVNAKRLYPEVDAKVWFREPEVVSFLKERLRNQERVTDQPYFFPTAKIYLEKPELWEDPAIFVNLRNLLPNFNNLLYGIPKNVAVANAGGLKVDRYNELETEIYFNGLTYEGSERARVSDGYMFLNRIMGVRFLLSTVPVEHFLLNKVKEITFSTGQDPVFVYEFFDYYPRVMMVPTAEKASASEIKAHLLAVDFDPKLKVFVEEDIDWGAEGGYAANAAFEMYADQEVVVSTQASGDGFLFLSDTYYPGWKAYVDGEEATIYRANYAFRAVPVPAGEHTVVFRFEPESFKWGLRITLGTAGATAVAFLMFALSKLSFLRKAKLLSRR